MAWPKGKPRPEGAGRKKGTPNKSSIPVMLLCEKYGVNPFEVMIEYLKHPAETLHPDVQIAMENQRFAAAKELAQYLAPKRKALELSLADLSTEELAAEIEARLGQKD